MFPRVVLAALLLVALPLAPVAAGDGIDPAKPAAAIAIPADGRTLVAWTPSAEPADLYKVYGLTEGGADYLGHVAGEYFLEVPASYSGYAVSAVVDGVEGEATPALALSGPPCITFGNEIPPSVTVGCLKKTPQVVGHVNPPS